MQTLCAAAHCGTARRPTQAHRLLCFIGFKGAIDTLRHQLRSHNNDRVVKMSKRTRQRRPR
jgi:hypothetical protein